MLVLRRITSENLEINTALGDEYVLVLRERNKKDFEKFTKSWSNEDLFEVYGLISFNDGSSIMPLYKKSNYYIMSSDGKTFDNLTEK